MPLPNLFSRKKSTEPPERETRPPRQPSSSPEKKSRSRTKADLERSYRSLDSRSKRNNSSRHNSDTHPLNLPPDQLRRLSALSPAGSLQQAMDAEMDDTRSPTPSSPPNTTPGAFPETNGVNGDAHDEAPAPPPHKETPETPAQAQPTPVDAEAFKTSGNKFFKAREWQKAIQEYTKAVEADPKSATYRSNRAAAYISAGKFAEALEDCKEADEMDPNNAKILHRLARVYTNLGRPKEAIQVYDRIQPPASAKDKAPATAMMRHVDEAEDQIRNGTSGSMALHALEQAQKGLGSTVIPPRKWQLLKCEAYLKMGNTNALGDAQNVAMSLLRTNNQDPEALVLRGRALYAQGENDKALQHFRSALSCDPDFKDAVKYLRMVQKLDRMKEEGNNHFKGGRYQQAVDQYTEALEVDPLNKGTNSKILQNRALCYSRLKEYKKAIADCERALQLDPSYTKARKTKAKALGESGNWEEAVRELKNIAEANPSEPGIAKEVRNAELELKKSKRKDYYKILAVDKDADESQVKKAYRKLAIVHHPDKNPGDEEAAERFKDIGEAYETLSDPQKRARYDSGEDLIDPSEMFGGGGGGGGFPGGMGGGGMGGISPEMLFNMMNGGGGGGGGGFQFQSGGGGSPFGGGGGGRQRAQGYPGGFSPFG